MPAPRAPLGEISGNRPKNIELTPVQRGFIEGAIQFGASFSKVAESLNYSKGTISNTLRLASERYNGESKPRPGRPQKWDDRLERRILRVIRSFPK
jgi:transposase